MLLHLQLQSPSDANSMDLDGEEARLTTNKTPASGNNNQSEKAHEFVSINDYEPIQIDGDEPKAEGEDVGFGTKRKLTSKVWKEFKKVKVGRDVKAQC